MTVTKLGAVLAILLLAAGCEGGGTKQTGGAIIGGVGGALLGSQIGSGSGSIIAATAGGLLGAWLGSEVGASLDRNDRQAAERSAAVALDKNPDGQATHWSNPESGNSGYTAPTKTYQTADNRSCRDYQTAVVVDGKTKTAKGTACRQADGTWQIVQ